MKIEEFRNKKFFGIFTVTMILDVLLFLSSLILLSGFMDWWSEPTKSEILFRFIFFIITLTSLILLIIFIKEKYRIKKWLINLGIFIFPVISIIFIWMYIRILNSLSLDNFVNSLLFLIPVILFILTSFYWIKYRKVFEK